MAKYIYLAVNTCTDGRYYAFTVRTAQNNNLISVLSGIKDIVSANVYHVKKDCDAVTHFWNQCYIQNGTYLFSGEAKSV